MAGERTPVEDVREIVRRLRMKQPKRQISRDLGLDRKTVRKYERMARARGWLESLSPPEAQEVALAVAAMLPEAGQHEQSKAEPFKGRIQELLEKAVEVKAIHQLLVEEGFTGSYSSVRRLALKIQPRQKEAVVRVEVGPGEEAQVDFGYAGRQKDPFSGELRRAWVFVMTLSYSRHCFAELVFDQRVETWLGLHARAFEFFGGVPRRVVLDNLKAAVTKACFYDPMVTLAYRQAAEHYGFLIAPCKVATPQHKGKVESGVRYVARNALAGRDFRDLVAGNEHLRSWCLDTAGLRKHGTTFEEPLKRFQAAEKAALLPLPEAPYEVAAFKQVKLHPDCHVVFEKAFYSAPHTLIGKKLVVKALEKRVEIYCDYERVATHSRAQHAGQRLTNHQHYPPEKLAGLLVEPTRLKEEAQAVGQACFTLVSGMLADKPVDRLRQAQGVLRLGKKYGVSRLENACQRALVFDNPSYQALKTILKRSLDQAPLQDGLLFSQGPVPKRAAFARPAFDLAAHFRRP